MFDGEPLFCLIDGKSVGRTWFHVLSPFYAQYRRDVAEARLLDVAAAIGAARSAERANLEARVACLTQAADELHFEPEHIEHTVRMSGLPRQVVCRLLEDIPRWLRQVPEALLKRFKAAPNSASMLVEATASGIQRLYSPGEGFCYAVTPANDPRAVALVCSNLGFLGIPCILKAAKNDAIAPLVIQALIKAGFDPRFFSLLYFDNRASEARQKHLRLVQAASSLWTFGARQDVDAALRFETPHARQEADVELRGGTSGADPAGAKDHFTGKTVLYHEVAACAAILSGDFDEPQSAFLAASLEYASGCSATRSAAVLSGEGWVQVAAETLSGWKCGDPLHPETEVGYILPANLDYLEGLLRKAAPISKRYGGERISPQQMKPVLLDCAQTPAALFGSEIPAYFLAVHRTQTTSEAVQVLNRVAGNPGRLAVSLWGLPGEEAIKAASRLEARAIWINKPTTHILPYYHEGNDYPQMLSRVSILD